MNRHFLLCWELGGSLGHLARLRPLAEALAAAGHRVSFAVRSVAGTAVLPAQFPVLAAATPGSARVPDPIREPASFADILYNDGITLADQRQAMVRTWRNLLELLQPDLVVGDYSPWALLAGQGLEIPYALLGTGFSCPPPQQELPDLRAWQNHYPERIRHTEAQVVDAISQQLQLQGEAPVNGVGDLYTRCSATLLATYPELDHYPQRNTGTQGRHKYCGVWSELAGQPPRWPQSGAKRVFAYLKPFRGLSRLLDHLETQDLSTLVYTQAAVDKTRWRRGNLVIEHQPLDMAGVLGDCDLVICHAGHGTAASALLAGTPLLLLPMNIEQYHNAQNVQLLGAGLSAEMTELQQVFVACERLLGEPAFAREAGRFARRYPTLSGATALHRVCQRLVDQANLRR